MKSSKNLPLVSIIIPNFNYGRFVSEAIESALSQTYEHVEVIVVDDGSTDDSVEVIRKFGNKITFIEQKNSGVVVARNAGAAAAHGDFFCFLDADDMLAETFVEKLLQPHLQSSDDRMAVTYCDYRYVDQQDVVVRGSLWNPRKLLYRNYIIPAAMIRQQAFEELGGYSLEVNQKFSFEDWDLWLSLSEAGYCGVYVPEALFVYRLHGQGRNVGALKNRAKLEQVLRDRHPKLYDDWRNRVYLMVMRTASRVRGMIIRPPGT